MTINAKKLSARDILAIAFREARRQRKIRKPKPAAPEDHEHQTYQIRERDRI